MQRGNGKGKPRTICNPGAIRLEAMASALCGLFDHVPGLQFWVKDRDGYYRWVNRGLLLNYALEQPEQVLGKTDYDLSPRHLADQFRTDDQLVLTGCPIVNRIELVGRFDHTAQWCVTNKIPLRRGDGEVLATAGISYPLEEESAGPTASAGDLGPCLAIIRRRAGESLSNEELAEAAGLSIRAFERKFRKSFGLSPQQYVMRLRIRMACSWLVYSDKPISEIAGAHGFCDQSHFTREFRRQLGMTPRRYRLNYQEREANSGEALT